MSESESEDEILDRIEAALRKIAGVSVAARPVEGEAFDRGALNDKLDDIIGKLRDGLNSLPPRAVEPAPEPVAPEPETEPAVVPVAEDEAPAEDDAAREPDIWPEPGA